MASATTCNRFLVATRPSNSAKTLKSMGDEPGMKRVLIAKQDDLRERGRLKAPDSWLNWALGITMKHGYEPNLILIGMLVFVSLGTWLFHSWLSSQSDE